MATEYTAKLLLANDRYVDRDGHIAYRDILGIYMGEVCVNLVSVESSVYRAGYDDAVVKAIGSHDFEWVGDFEWC